MLSSIGYDFRQVSGPLDAEPSLVDAVRRARHARFLRQLSRRALDLTPPTGFLRDLVVQAKGEHAGRLDIKHGGITIVNNLARCGRSAPASRRRTRSRAWMPPAPPRTRRHAPRELSEAFRFLWDVRLRHQAAR